MDGQARRFPALLPGHRRAGEHQRQAGEIGLRVALGVRPDDIFELALGRAGRFIAAGHLIGICAAAALARLLSGTLYGVEPNGPGTPGTHRPLRRLDGGGRLLLPGLLCDAVSIRW